MEEVKNDYSISVVRACRIVGLSTSAAYYKSCKDDSEVITKLQSLAVKHPTRGFGVYYGRIRNEGLKWNHKRVKRIYNLMGLNIRRKHKRRLPHREKIALEQPDGVNKKWSMDFMSDALTDGRKFRTFNLIDDFNREVLAVEADTSLPARRVVRILERVIREKGKPGSIRVDNGPEFISHTLESFCKEHQIRLQFIKPGKPMQNGYVERFNRTYREDILDAYLFTSIKEVRVLSQEWIQDYNHHHPHGSLGGYSPVGYRQAVESGKLAARTCPPEFTTYHSSVNNNNNDQGNILTSNILNPLKSNSDLS
jgi:putative transposase